jgi:hypothetical protein
MKEFTFNGDWEFKLNLNDFFNSNLRWRLNMDPQNAKPNVKIVDLKSYDPDPLKEQINTINFIINNESRVLEAICKALVPINNDYGERCGQYDWFPERLTAENLGEVLLIQEISILKEHKDDQAYYELSCGYKGDEEHGLIIVMHGVQLFDYSAIGEMDYINLYKDLGERAKIFIEINKIENEFQAPQMQKVLPKYGKYKPWQKELLVEYLSKLLRTKENEKLKEIISRGEYKVKHRIDFYNRNLVDLAAHYGNIEMIEYAISKGGDFSRAMLYCSGTHLKKDVVECLVKHGASVDILHWRGETALNQAITKCSSAMFSAKRNKDRDENTYNKAVYELEKQKDRIQFYLSMGANPNSINTNGDDFKTVLKKMWEAAYEEGNRIIKEIEELINSQ